MKKRIFSMILLFVFAFVCMSCGKNDTGDNNQPTQQAPSTGRFTPGTYEGTATGYGGEIKATVVLTADRIDSITVSGENETQGVGSVAVQTMPQAMVDQQTVNVDMVTGATRSSTAIIDAVTSALTSAGVDVNTLGSGSTGDTGTTPMTDETKSADIVVIGAGGAGMTAAVEATAAGRKVIIVEKMPMVGGNTVYATGGMNAAGTQLQNDQGEKDTPESFFEDTMKGGNYTNNESLVRVLAEKSAEGVDWLKGIGADLTQLTFSGGASHKRMHAPEGGAAVGPYIVDALSKQITENNIEVLYDTKATDIMTENGQITGVKATGKNVNYTINCEAVILATGGFGANSEMIAKYNKELADFKTTNAAGATGDGIIMAEAVGANIIDMEQIQVHPTVEQSTSTLITESVRGGGAILVNQKGERFYNEMDTRNKVSAAIMEQEGSYAYLIFDQQLRDNLKAVEKYISADLVDIEDNLTELAEQIGVPPETLVKTVADWNSLITDKTTDTLGRTTGMDTTISQSPYYAIKIAPAIHHTMGGVEIDSKAEVIDTKGNVIPGFFAAGEVTGGVHGQNRIGGNAVAEIIVFGRIAGQSASEYVNAN